MQASARIADPFDQSSLDEAVDVFVRSGDRFRGTLPFVKDLLQRRENRRGVLGAEQARGFQRLGPGDAAGHIVFEEQPIEAKGDAEVEGGGIGRRVEPAGPERHA